MILFHLYAGFGSGLKVSGGNSFEFYANLKVFHLFRCFSGLFVFFDGCSVLLVQMGIEKTPFT